MSLFCLLLMILALNTNFYFLIIAISLFGFFLMPLIPLLLEYACELLYPAVNYQK